MKKFLMMLALMAGVVTANAQKTLEIPNTILDNTYIGVGVGVYTPLQFTEVLPLNTTASLRIGKELNPVVALELEGTAAFGSHTHHNGRYSVHQAVRATNVGLNGTVNLSNLLLGYKGENRNFELLTVTGLGWGHGFVNEAYGKDVNSLTAKTGLEARFKINDGLSFTAQPVVLWALTNTGRTGVEFNSGHAQLGVTVGLVYRFKNSNGTHSWGEIYDVGALNDEINRLRAEVEELKGRPAEKVVETVEVIKPVVTVDYAEKSYTVFFAQGSAELSAEQKTVLDKIGAGTIVDIIATASPEGTKKFNQKISEERASVVKEYLVNRGVNIKSAEGKGVIGENSNRVAIIQIVD